MAMKKKSIWNCIFAKLLKKWILLERENRKLRKLVSHDPLTGALSRVEFEEKVEYFLSLSKRFSKNRTQKCFSIVFIDINKFKDINDTYGHQAGDNLLISFANFLKNLLRESDFVGRMGGDEFVLFLEEDDLESGKEVMERIQSILSLSLMSIGDEDIFITASFGVASTSEGIYDLGELLKEADQKMYKQKENR